MVQEGVLGLLILVCPLLEPSLISPSASVVHTRQGNIWWLTLGAVPTMDDFGIMGIVLVTIIAISTGVVVDGI